MLFHHLIVFSVLGFEPRASHVLGKHSTTEVYPDLARDEGQGHGGDLPKPTVLSEVSYLCHTFYQESFIGRSGKSLCKIDL